MAVRIELIALVGLLVAGGPACSGGQLRGAESVVRSRAQAPEAIAALQASRFDEAEQLARDRLAREDRNAQAHLVAAVTRYKRAMHQLATDVVAIGAGAFVQGLNRQYLAFSLTKADEELAAVEAHLKAAGRDPDVALELCLAGWEVDWNRNGRVDERDRRLLEIEVGADGQELPEGDPRRRPTFRFDAADVSWARAMIAFQRAVLQLGLAYELPEPREVLEAGNRDDPSARRVVIRLADPARVLATRDLILNGLAQADLCRRQILAEKDDQREWLPGPHQKDHPMPLPVDQQLFDTWAGVVSDLRALLAGETGLSIAERAQLGDHRWADPPQGYLHLGRLLEKPGDIVFDLANLERLGDDQTRTNAEAVLRDVFGDKYVAQIRPTPLIQRLGRMKSEVERGEETLERKLRYLFWLN